jgi:hypothetical protein
MAYLMTHFWPAGTEDQYHAMLAAVHPDDLPAGQVYHAAGPTERGFLIAAVWDSNSRRPFSGATRGVRRRCSPSRSQG